MSQKDMYERAAERYAACMEKATTWEDFMGALERKHMVLAPWCVHSMSYVSNLIFHTADRIISASVLHESFFLVVLLAESIHD